MNLEDYRTALAVVILGLVLVAAFPTISLYLPSIGERFSEPWLLGPEHMAEGYPSDVKAGEIQGPLYVGVSNRMGCSKYYMVCVKFRNQTQSSPNATTSEPSPLPPLYEFQFFLADGETWEAPVTFIIEDASFEEDNSSVTGISINGHAFPVALFTSWDSQQNGFFYQLFFELWLYSEDLQDLQFHNRFAWVWLNMTG